MPRREWAWHREKGNKECGPLHGGPGMAHLVFNLWGAGVIKGNSDSKTLCDSLMTGKVMASTTLISRDTEIYKYLWSKTPMKTLKWTMWYITEKCGIFLAPCLHQLNGSWPCGNLRATIIKQQASLYWTRSTWVSIDVHSFSHKGNSNVNESHHTSPRGCVIGILDTALTFS